MKGGYNQIDFSGVDVTSETPITITGVYKNLVECIENNKTTIFYNISSNGKKLTPSFYSMVLGTNEITITLSDTIVITVSNEDEVTVVIAD